MNPIELMLVLLGAQAFHDFMFRLFCVCFPSVCPPTNPIVLLHPPFWCIACMAPGARRRQLSLGVPAHLPAAGGTGIFVTHHWRSCTSAAVHSLTAED